MKAESYINRKTGQPLYNVIGWYCSEKFDGQRAQWDPKRQVLLSRYGNVIPAPPAFVEPLKSVQHQLDGELFMGYGNWDLTGIFRNRQKDSQDRNRELWKRVTYIVFDIADPDSDYNQRYRVLERLATQFPVHIILVERTLIQSKAALETIYQGILQRGGEGVMLTNPHSFYRDGRTDNLLKYKPVMEEQCIIVGYKEGNGKYAGRLGSFIVHPIEDGEIMPYKEFSIAGITDAVRSSYKRTHPIGTVLNYRCSDVTKSGKPRFPVYIGICRKVVTPRQIPTEDIPTETHTPKGLAKELEAKGIPSASGVIVTAHPVPPVRPAPSMSPPPPYTLEVEPPIDLFIIPPPPGFTGSPVPSPVPVSPPVGFMERVSPPVQFSLPCKPLPKLPKIKPRIRVQVQIPAQVC